MSWGTELWDQYDNLGQHTQKGIEFLEKYGSFIKERCSIESDYANRLRKLAKNYQPKKKEEDDHQFSSSIAFVKMLTEINDMAGQHETISELYAGQLMKEINDLVKELKDERKKHLQDGSRYQSNLQNSRYSLDKYKRAYEKSFKEAEKANDTFVKIDADINLSRADVEKARIHAQLKSRSCEDCKTDYANQLQKTNELQRLHFNDLMPNIFQLLQEMEERRIACVQNVMKRTADVHKQVLPYVQKCLDEIIKSAESINPREDSLLVIEKFKSGYDPPDDIPFEDLSNPSNGVLSNTLSSSKSDSLTVRGTLGGGKNKKRGRILNIFSNSKNVVDETKEDFSDLPPMQRKKKLQQKIDDIDSKIGQETNARDGLMKMKSAYEQNPAMGDPATIEGQLTDNGLKLEKLQQEKQKFQGYMLEAEGHGGSALSLSREHRSSISEDSLSRSASDSSVSNPLSYKRSAPGTPQQLHGSSNSPESGIGTSQPSITDEAESYPDPEFENEYEYGDDFDAILGTGKALYPFTGQNEGSIDISEGEEFDVVELDQGDGWTRVRKRNFEEGFVPTSYIETYLYNNC